MHELDDSLISIIAKNRHDVMVDDRALLYRQGRSNLNRADSLYQNRLIQIQQIP